MSDALTDSSSLPVDATPVEESDSVSIDDATSTDESTPPVEAGLAPALADLSAKAAEDTAPARIGRGQAIYLSPRQGPPPMDDETPCDPDTTASGTLTATEAKTGESVEAGL